MFYWGTWIGPLIATLLSLRLRPAYLVLLGLATMVGFIVSFNISESLYPDCLDTGCPPAEHRLRWVNGILFTIAPALFLLAVLKSA